MIRRLLSLWIVTVGCWAADRPNVILILTDDENLNTVGCYGGDVETPNIDSLATNGIRFANANVVSTVCCPSRYTTLTGRYYNNCYHPHFLEAYPTGTASCISNNVELERDGMNVAAILKDNGYRTGFCGKFHLAAHGLLGTNRGWENGGLLTYDPSINPLRDPAVSKKMKHNHDYWVGKIAEYGFDYVQGVYSANARELFNDHLKGHNIEWTADAALRFLDGYKQDKKPFFLYMATTYPHGPAPERRVKGKLPMSLDQDIRLTGEGVVSRDMSLSPNREALRKKYYKHENDEAITAAWWDTAVGAVLKKLRDIGQEENTLIIYASDHGRANGGKTTLYENGCHVPLIMQWKGTVKPGSVYPHLAANLDYVPTILDVCNISKPAGMKIDGRSLGPILRGSLAPVRDALLLEMGYARAIKTDRWKYIAVRYPEEVEKKIKAGRGFKGFRGEAPMKQPYLIEHKQLAQKSASKNPHYFSRNQLYDLKTDPTESENAFTQHPERALELQDLMKRELRAGFAHRPFGEFTRAERRK